MLLLGGCATRSLMPAPNLYGAKDAPELFGELPTELQGNRVDLLYVTDRAPETDELGDLAYGYGRSWSAAFGSAIVTIEPELDWQDLKSVSLEQDRSPRLTMRLISIEERGRFPESPPPIVLIDGLIQPDPSTLERARQTEQMLHAELRKRLALAPKQEVVVFVHGYNNEFEDAAQTLAELWHFLGREHIPILYTWPAGRGGASGYIYDRESGEFTVYHLKNLLRSLGNLQDIEKVHLVAHSRGTAVASSALRELFLESRAAGENAREKFRISNLILAAPDMDLDVVMQRIVSEQVGRDVDQLVVYTSQQDKAISIAERLFKSVTRLGRLEVSDLSEDQLESLQSLHRISFIELQGKSDSTGHGYFHSSPAASSDLIMVVRYDLGPGAENGRPLKPGGPDFWIIEQGYPNLPGPQE